MRSMRLRHGAWIGLGCALAVGCDADGRTLESAAATAPTTAMEAAELDDGGLPVPGAGADECIVVMYVPADASFRRDDFVHRVRRSYDEATRVVEERSVDEMMGRAPAGQGDLFWLYDSEGRLLAYAGVEFRYDYEYDDHGNLSVERVSHPASRDLFAPRDPLRILTVHENHYDGERLTESATRATDPEAGRRTFHEDEKGRCDRVGVDYTRADVSDVIETRAYDERDRLVRTEVVSVPDAPRKVHTVRDYAYDDSGRLVSMEQQGGGLWRALAEGRVDVAQYVSSRDDGTRVTEDVDFTTDTPDGYVERDGMPRPAGIFYRIASAGCSALEQRIPQRTGGTHCRLAAREDNAY